MLREVKKYRRGFTLIEMIMGVLISLILILAVGVLLAGGQQSWQQTYHKANKQIKIEALGATALFGAVARKSDHRNYILTDSTYILTGSTSRASGTPAGMVVLSSTEVEFRYWADHSREGRSRRLPSKEPTHYARFYFDKTAGELKVDYGRLLPDRKQDRIQILAHNVNFCKFDHTVVNGLGQGCVRMVLTLRDPEDGEEITVKTAAGLRN